MIVALLTGCAGGDGTKDATGRSHDAGFSQTMAVADSLFNSMQFRDAYKLYLQQLDSKEAKADTEKRLSVLYALSNTSELSGHKIEQHKWLQQLHDLAVQTGNYIQQLRLDHAARLLVDQPERSIAQIAADCGFSSSSYFSTCFRQYFGIRPTDFRQETAASAED